MIIREVLAHFGVTTDGETAVRQISASMNLAQAEAAALAGAFAQLAGVVTAFAGTAAFVHWQAGIADSIGDTAEALGISTDALQAWQHAAQLNGSSAEEMTGALERLQRSLGDASQGGAEQVAALRALGVNYKDASGNIRPMEDILMGVAEGIANTEDPARRAAAATDLFGRQGTRLIPLLSRGRAGVAALARDFKELGGGASPEAVKAASDYNNNIDRLNLAFFSLSQRIANFFLPMFVRITDFFVSGARSFFSFVDKTHLVEAALMTVFGVLTTVGVAAALKLILAFAPIIGTALLVAGGIAVIVLIVDDLLALFRGGRSVTGTFVDSLFGIGTAAKGVAKITDTLKQAWVEVANAIDRSLEAARGGMRILNAIVGTADDALNERGLAERLSRAVQENVEENRNSNAQRDTRSLTEEINQRVREQQRIAEGAAQFGVAFRTDTGARDPNAPVSDADQAPRAGARERRTVEVPTQAGRGTGDTSVTMGGAQVNITVPQGTSREQVQAIESTIRRVNAEQLEQALSAVRRQRIEE